MNRCHDIAFTLCVWGYVLLGFSYHYIVSSVLIFLRVKNKEEKIYWLGSKVCLAGLKFLRIPIKVTGLENIPKNQKMIIVCNHQSLFDIVILTAILPVKFLYIAKKELLNVPIIGTDIKRMGHYWIDRKSPLKAKSQMKRMKDDINNGQSVLFFPEGTRSVDQQIAPFKKGAFVVATETKTPVVPCHISGSGHFLKKGSLWAKKVNIRLQIAPLIESANLENKKQAAEDLSLKAYKTIVSLQEKTKD